MTVQGPHRAADDSSTGFQDRIIEDDEGRAIREEKADARPLPYAKPLKPIGGAIDGVSQFRVAQGLSEKSCRRARRKAGRRLIEETRQRRRVEALEPVYLPRVGLQPGVGYVARRRVGPLAGQTGLF